MVLKTVVPLRGRPMTKHKCSACLSRPSCFCRRRGAATASALMGGNDASGTVSPRHPQQIVGQLVLPAESTDFLPIAYDEVDRGSHFAVGAREFPRRRRAEKLRHPVPAGAAVNRIDQF